MEKLKKIYKEKLIEKVTTLDYNKYYYFYKPTKNNELFAIEKDISKNEYELIKSSYIEKKIYDNRIENQAIYEYLFENGNYPFSIKKVKIIIADYISNQLEKIFNNFYAHVWSIRIDELQVFFCEDNYEIKLEQLLTTLSDDLGENVKIHEGIYVKKEIPGSVVLNYIAYIKKYMSEKNELYSDFTSPIKSITFWNDTNYISLINDYIIAPLLKDSNTKDIILTYFKKDLNVLQTAKELYINRNSLLKKFETIYKDTGLDIQKFSHACALYIFTWIKNEDNNKN